MQSIFIYGCWNPILKLKLEMKSKVKFNIHIKIKVEFNIGIKVEIRSLHAALISNKYILDYSGK